MDALLSALCVLLVSKMGTPYLSHDAWEIMRASGPKIIERVKGVGKNRPTCEAHVRVAAGDTHTKRARFNKAMREGRDPKICGCRAMWRINKRNYCQGHAGQQAIDMLVMLANGGSIG